MGANFLLTNLENIMVQIYKIGRILLNRRLIEIKQLAKGAVLDVGSGGKDYRWIFDNHTKYLTLEIDKKFAPDIIGSAYDVPLADNSIDTVVCTQVLEHLDKPAQAMREFYRILKPEGVAIISAPFFNELHEEPADFFRYTIYGLRKLAEEAGFQEIKIEPIGGYFALRAQILIKYFWLKYLDKPIRLNILAVWSKFYCRLMLLLDRLDKSPAKEKFTINYLMIVKK